MKVNKTENRFSRTENRFSKKTVLISLTEIRFGEKPLLTSLIKSMDSLQIRGSLAPSSSSLSYICTSIHRFLLLLCLIQLPTKSSDSEYIGTEESDEPDNVRRREFLARRPSYRYSLRSGTIM